MWKIRLYKFQFWINKRNLHKKYQYRNWEGSEFQMKMGLNWYGLIWDSMRCLMQKKTNPKKYVNLQMNTKLKGRLLVAFNFIGVCIFSGVDTILKLWRCFFSFIQSRWFFQFYVKYLLCEVTSREKKYNGRQNQALT